MSAAAQRMIWTGGYGAPLSRNRRRRQSGGGGFPDVVVKLLRTSAILIERNQRIMCMRVLCPAALAGALTNNADAMMLSDVCLSVCLLRTWGL